MKYYVFFLVVIMLCIFMIPPSSSSVIQETLLVTQSIYDKDRIQIYIDDRFPNNDWIMIHTILQHLFPFRLSGSMQQSDVILHPYDQFPYKNDFHLLFSLYPVSMTWIIPLMMDPVDSIHSLKFALLKNHYSSSFFQKVLSVLRIQLQYPIQYVDSYHDLDILWKKGIVNSIFLLCSHPDKFVQLFTYKYRVKIMDWTQWIDNPRAQILQFYFPNFIRTHIPVSDYRIFSLKQEVPSFGTRLGCYFHKAVDVSYANALLETVYRNMTILNVQYPFLKHWDARMMLYCPITEKRHLATEKYD